MSASTMFSAQVAMVLSPVVALLLVALLSSGLRDRRRAPAGSVSELTRRVRTWWWLLGLFAGSLALGRGALIALFGLVSYLALKEFFSLIPTRRTDRRVLFWAYLAVPAQFVWVAMEWYGMFVVFVPVWAAIAVQTRMILLRETQGFLHASSTIQYGLMLCVFSLSHVAYLAVLPDASGGAGWVVLFVLLTQLGDVAQYLWGRGIGGPKVLPEVSPGKTWAGLLGGVGTVLVLAALLGPVLTPLGRGEAAVLGAVVALGGFFGDLCISCVKRDLGVKDTGASLPGHGGILDRLDSTSFAAPMFFHLAYWLHG